MSSFLKIKLRKVQGYSLIVECLPIMFNPQYCKKEKRRISTKKYIFVSPADLGYRNACPNAALDEDIFLQALLTLLQGDFLKQIFYPLPLSVRLYILHTRWFHCIFNTSGNTKAGSNVIFTKSMVPSHCTNKCWQVL